MDKRKTKSGMIFSLIVITIIEYILFSTQAVAMFPFVSTIILGYIYYIADNKNSKKVYIIYSILLSVLVYGFTFGFGHSDNIFNYLLTSANVHIISIILSDCFIKGNDFSKSICKLSSGQTLIYVAELGKYKFIDKIKISDEIKNTFDEFMNQNATIISSNLSANSTDISDIISQLKDIVIVIIPLLLIISAILLSFVLYEIFRLFICSFTGKKFGDERKFRNFRVKGSLSLFTIVMYIISIIANDLMFSNIILNFAIIASFLYISNGYAIVVFYIYKKIKNNALAVILSILTINMLILSVSLLPTFNGIYILFILGLFDNRFDFRKINRNPVGKTN